MAPLLRQILPALRSYVGITMRAPQKNAPVQAVNGRCVGYRYWLAWIVVKGNKLQCLRTPMCGAAAFPPRS
jgi:hypothetical protein